MLGNAFLLDLASDHEAGDVLQEDERRAPLAAQFDEVRAFLRRFGEQDAVVGDDPDRHAPQMREAGHQRAPVTRLPLRQFAVVDQARNHFVHIVGFARIGRYHAVEIFDRKARPQWLAHVEAMCRRGGQAGHGAARNCQGMRVVFRQVISDSRQARVHIAATQILGAATTSPVAACASGRPPRRIVP